MHVLTKFKKVLLAHGTVVPRSSRILVSLGFALLLTVVAAWWSMASTKSVQYVAVPVTRGTVMRVVTATGTINPVLTVVVGTYVSGIIQHLYCDYNTQVRAGQVCAKIDPRPYQAVLNQYIAQQLRDQAILEKDRANLARYQSLKALDSIARQQADDQVYVVQQDEATVRLDQALVEGAKLNLNYTDIVSPVDGTVVSRSVTGGQTVAASFQTPTLFLIATDLKQMEVDTNSSEGDMGGIKEGAEATFTVDAFPQRTFHGKVTQIRQSPQTVQNVVTYDVVIGVANSDFALMPGMTASVLIISDRRDDVLRVPNQALRYVPGGRLTAQAPGAGRQSQLWVLRDGQLLALNATFGLSDTSFTEIAADDLQPTDQVIISEVADKVGQPAFRPSRP
jgi:HlyD family secretion protein